MKRDRSAAVGPGMGSILFVTAMAAADSAQIDATRDGGFLNLAQGNNLGAHTHVSAGRSNNTAVHRAVFFFDVAGAIPAGATITGATFEFDVTNQGGPMGQAGDDFTLRRVTTDWDEGTGVGNLGSPTGDGASWLEAMGGVPWVTPGGDFVGASSGSVFIDQPDPGLVTYTLGNAQLVTDVQAMLDGPGGNFGFLLQSGESITGSGLRITTRENVDPLLGEEARLIVEFRTGGADCPGDTNDDDVVDFTDLLAVLSSWGPCPGCDADLDGNDVVDFTDLLAVLSGWGPCP